MIDSQTAEEGLQLISSAIAELLEGAAGEAAMRSLSPAGMATRIRMLRAANRDLGVLVDTLDVLSRAVAGEPDGSDYPV